jgi:hypothetical protein
MLELVHHPLDGLFLGRGFLGHRTVSFGQRLLIAGVELVGAAMRGIRDFVAARGLAGTSGHQPLLEGCC